VSLVARGRALGRLPFSGGQFVQLRVLRRGLWWQAHPYSLSALPRNGRLRLTVRDAGDFSRALTKLEPGTRLALEGPYGAFTKHARHDDGLLLVGAGVGVAPIVALLEDLPGGTDVEVIVRASSEDELVLRDEVRALAARHGAGLHELVGPRELVRLDAGALAELVPDVHARDLYVCGPDGFMTTTVDAAVTAGADPGRVHWERFAF
jgi:ferredoxin-NADP reductase